MIGQYKIITLCGSTRFKDAFMEAQKRLTLEGNIVISVGLFGHAGDEEVWENMDEGTLTATKKMLDDMHKRKIDLADEIYVINVGGYIGESTRSEIAYALETGKGVKYMEEPAEEPAQVEPETEQDAAETGPALAEAKESPAEAQTPITETEKSPAKAQPAASETEDETGKNVIEEDLPIIGEPDVRTIKIKLGKGHRKESDWEVIKQILSSHSVMTMVPEQEDPQISVFEGMLYEDGAFIVFTNEEDLQRHVRLINEEDSKPERIFRVLALPFDQVISAADYYQKDAYIDYLPEAGAMFIAYTSKTQTLQAVMLD